MVFKIFLDANVILDFMLKRVKYEISKKVISLVVQKKVKGYTTPAIIHIVAYWMSKYYGSLKAKELIIILLNDLRIIEIDHKTALLALHSSIDDVEDALQYYTALKYKLDFFITQDKRLISSEFTTIRVMDPEFFLKEILNDW